MKRLFVVLHVALKYLYRNNNSVKSIVLYDLFHDVWCKHISRDLICCLPLTKECFCPCLSVWLSVSKITQKRVHGFWMKRCVSTDVGTWANWLTFEPNPDYSPEPDCFLQCISAAMQNFTSGKSHIYVLAWPAAAASSSRMRWAALCAEPDLRLESPGRRYRRGSSWLCDRDP